MMWSGPLILLFVVYHVLHLTTGAAHHDFRPGDVYHNVVSGFQRWPAALAYIAAMLALAYHLSHGVWSVCQTVGLNRPQWDRTLRRLALAASMFIAFGFIAVPAAVLAGLVTLRR